MNRYTQVGQGHQRSTQRSVAGSWHSDLVGSCQERNKTLMRVRVSEMSLLLAGVMSRCDGMGMRWDVMGMDIEEEGVFGVWGRGGVRSRKDLGEALSRGTCRRRRRGKARQSQARQGHDEGGSHEPKEWKREDNGHCLTLPRTGRIPFWAKTPQTCLPIG